MVLGKLACFVLSKIVAIGSAERNWKQYKYLSKKSTINNNKCKKATLIYAPHQNLRSKHMIECDMRKCGKMKISKLVAWTCIGTKRMLQN